MASKKKDPYAPLRKLPFMFWHDLSEDFEDDPVIFGIFVDIMAHLARIPGEWLSVESFYESIGQRRKARMAGTMMMRLARNFEDWILVLECSMPHSRRFNRAAQEVRRRCRSFDQFRRYAHTLRTTEGYVPQCRELLPILMQRAKTFDQWYEVWCFTEVLDAAPRKEVRDKLEQVTTTPEQQEKIRSQEWWLDPKNREDLLRRMQLANRVR